MNIPVKFHAAVIARNKEGQFSCEIQVVTEQNQIITVFADTFFDPITAMQSMTVAYGEMQQ